MISGPASGHHAAHPAHRRALRVEPAGPLRVGDLRCSLGHPRDHPDRGSDHEDAPPAEAAPLEVGQEVVGRRRQGEDGDAQRERGDAQRRLERGFEAGPRRA